MPPPPFSTIYYIVIQYVKDTNPQLPHFPVLQVYSTYVDKGSRKRLFHGPLEKIEKLPKYNIALAQPRSASRSFQRLITENCFDASLTRLNLILYWQGVSPKQRYLHLYYCTYYNKAFLNEYLATKGEVFFTGGNTWPKKYQPRSPLSLK